MFEDKNDICKFRFHRGALDESLKTCVEVNSKAELCDIINKDFEYLKTVFQPEDIEINFYATDDRIAGWEETYIVRIPKIGGVVGFTNKLIRK